MTASSIPDAPAFADALSPLERADEGLQDELSIWEIAKATYPEKEACQDGKRLTGFLLQAIKAGRLAAYGNPDGWFITRGPGPQIVTPYPRCEGHQGSPVPGSPPGSNRNAPPHPLIGYRFKLPGDWCVVNRADYLAILASPAARGIPAPDWWKAPQGEPEPLPQGEPGKPESGAPAKRTALKSLLTEIDLRAKKAGAGFNRHSLPGTKDEFARLLKAHCPEFRHIGTERIAAYLKGTCQFQRGAKPDQGKGAAVWALFPEYDLK